MLKKYGVSMVIAVIILGGLWWVIVMKNKSTDYSSKLGSSQANDTIVAAQDIENLPEAKPFEYEPTDLKNGDVFDMVITPVKKNINGQWVKMLGYNGSVPGPVLRIPQGAEITVRLTNNGDIATTLHSHGVRVDNAFDGVPGVTQKAINPGETFEYKLRFPDAGVFWYHPHIRTDYALESGLYGNYIVTPTDTAYWSPVNREVSIMLDDIAMDKDGMLPFSKDMTDHTLMGRFGNVMFTNGETEFQPEAKQGEVVRLYFTNAANTRVFNVAIPGAKMKLVGADLGRYEQEKFTDEIVVAPGERRVVDVLFEKAGAYQLIQKTPGKRYVLETIAVSDTDVVTSYAQEFNTLRSNVTVSEEMNTLMTTYLNKTPDKKLRLELGMNGAGQNMMMWKFTDDITGKSNMDVMDDWKFKVGDKVKISIFNDPKSAHSMYHPIHFHGQRFMVLSTNGVKNDNPVWQDTTLIPKGDTVDILLETSNPGMWMAHCHILEHAENGMMISFMVE